MVFPFSDAVWTASTPLIHRREDGLIVRCFSRRVAMDINAGSHFPQGPRAGGLNAGDDLRHPVNHAEPVFRRRGFCLTDQGAEGSAGQVDHADHGAEEACAGHNREYEAVTPLRRLEITGSKE